MKKYGMRINNSKYYYETTENNTKLLKGAIEVPNGYIDPDRKIVEEQNIDGINVRFSPDGICGINYLMSYYEGQDIDEAYSIIRSKEIMWPKHIQSINQRRYSFFRDRIDFTIYDIKEFYASMEKESRLVRKDSLSAKYLMEIGSFNNFIDEYGFDGFVEKGRVKNLSTGETINGYDDYEFSREVNQKYIEGLLTVLREEKGETAKE